MSVKATRTPSVPQSKLPTELAQARRFGKTRSAQSTALIAIIGSPWRPCTMMRCIWSHSISLAIGSLPIRIGRKWLATIEAIGSAKYSLRCRSHSA